MVTVQFTNKLTTCQINNTCLRGWVDHAARPRCMVNIGKYYLLDRILESGELALFVMVLAAIGTFLC